VKWLLSIRAEIGKFPYLSKDFKKFSKSKPKTAEFDSSGKDSKVKILRPSNLKPSVWANWGGTV
jgi:hypothetical protein